MTRTKVKTGKSGKIDSETEATLCCRMLSHLTRLPAPLRTTTGGPGAGTPSRVHGLPAPRSQLRGGASHAPSYKSSSSNACFFAGPAAPLGVAIPAGLGGKLRRTSESEPRVTFGSHAARNASRQLRPRGSRRREFRPNSVPVPRKGQVFRSFTSPPVSERRPRKRSREAL